MARVGNLAMVNSFQRAIDKNVAVVSNLGKMSRLDLDRILEPDQIAMITNDTLATAENIALLKYEAALTTAECLNFISNSEKEPDESDEQVIKRIKLGIKEQLNTYDPKTAEIVTEVKDMFKSKAKKSQSRLSEGIEIVEQELSERDFICPFTATRFVDPLKNSACPHRVSKAGLNALLKNKNAASCPVPGCRAMWTKASSSPDNDFSIEMERFLRVKNASQSATHSQGSSQRG